MRFIVGIMLLLCATMVQAGTIIITWDTVPSVSTYRISYGFASGIYNFDIDTMGDILTISGVNDCQEYYIAVASVGAEEVSPYSNEIHGWPRPEIYSIVPQLIIQGMSSSFTIYGVNFKPGSTVEFDDPLITVLSQQVNSCYEMEATVLFNGSVAAGPISFDVVQDDRVFGFATNLLDVEDPRTNWYPEYSFSWICGYDTVNPSIGSMLYWLERDPEGTLVEVPCIYYTSEDGNFWNCPQSMTPLKYWDCEPGEELNIFMSTKDTPCLTNSALIEKNTIICSQDGYIKIGF